MVADDSAMCFSEGQAGKKMKKDRNQMGTLKEENCERKRLSRKQENRGGWKINLVMQRNCFATSIIPMNWSTLILCILLKRGKDISPVSRIPV